MKTKLSSLLLSVILICGLVSCSESLPNTGDPDKTAQTNETSEKVEGTETQVITDINASTNEGYVFLSNIDHSLNDSSSLSDYLDLYKEFDDSLKYGFSRYSKYIVFEELKDTTIPDPYDQSKKLLYKKSRCFGLPENIEKGEYDYIIDMYAGDGNLYFIQIVRESGIIWDYDTKGGLSKDPDFFNNSDIEVLNKKADDFVKKSLPQEVYEKCSTGDTFFSLFDTTMKIYSLDLNGFPTDISFEVHFNDEGEVGMFYTRGSAARVDSFMKYYEKITEEQIINAQNALVEKLESMGISCATDKMLLTLNSKGELYLKVEVVELSKLGNGSMLVSRYFYVNVI